jgi:hypothetical protein
VQDETGVERMYTGQCDDLRRAFVSHIAGTKGTEELRQGMRQNEVVFRYWEQDNLGRRLEVIAALIDLHCYEWGHEEVTMDVACINLNETQ